MKDIDGNSIGTYFFVVNLNIQIELIFCVGFMNLKCNIPKKCIFQMQLKVVEYFNGSVLQD